MTSGFIISGTDTGIGKTVFAAALVHALTGDYWKPVQSGIEETTDTQNVKALSGLPDDHFHREAYTLQTPCSPHRSAEIDGVEIDLAALGKVPSTDRPLIIEGAGGLLVPLTRRALLIEMFAAWQRPVILCARTSLGTINHTLLSVEALRARNIELAGIAFIGEEVADSEKTICDFAATRHLGRLPLIDPFEPTALHAAFAANFDLAELS